MARLRLALVALIICSLAAFAGVLLAPRSSPSEERAAGDLTDGWAGSVRPPGTRMPDFALRDQDGRSVTAASLRGGPVVVAFIYSHCEDTCPAEVATIRGALDDLGARAKGVRVVGISVDPPNDTQRSTRSFLLKQYMTGRMSFLRGSRAELEPVWKAFGIQPQDELAEDPEKQDHTASVVTVDAQGRQRTGFLYQYFTSQRLAHDLTRLLA